MNSQSIQIIDTQYYLHKMDKFVWNFNFLSDFNWFESDTGYLFQGLVSADPSEDATRPKNCGLGVRTLFVLFNL